MRKRKILMFGLLLLSNIILMGCKKEGCTDTDATNYDSGAKTNDNSCTYKGRYVIWYGEATANAMVDNGMTTLTYYVDGANVGNSSTSVFATVTPDCGAEGSITVEKDLGKETEKTFPYSVKDQSGSEIWSGNLTFSANTCASREIVW